MYSSKPLFAVYKVGSRGSAFEITEIKTNKKSIRAVARIYFQLKCPASRMLQAG